MKSKIAKIWGISLALILLASLVIMVAPASAGTLTYTPVSTPNSLFNVVTASTANGAGDNSIFAMSKDGMNMFIYDNVRLVFYRSTNGGATWSSTNIGTGLNGDTVADMAVSPNYDADHTLAVVTTSASATNVNQVLRSVDSGKTWSLLGDIAATVLADVNYGAGILTGAPPLSSLTSIDIGAYYMGGLAYLVGFGDAAPDAVPALLNNGGVRMLTEANRAWADQALPNDPAVAYAAGVDQPDVLDVAFSPNHQSDAQFLALSVDGAVAGVAGNTLRLWAKFGTEGWGATVVPAGIGDTDLTIAGSEAVGAVPTFGRMVFPDDYEWSSNNRILVGISGSAADDLYEVKGAFAGGQSLFRDLNVGGTGTATAVSAVACSGTYVGANVVVGTAANSTVYRAADPSTTNVTWYTSRKNPPGGAIAALAYANDATYAATTGNLSALAKSADSGDTFNGAAMIELSATNFMAWTDVEVVDADTMFALLYDDFNYNYVADAGDRTMVFKTTNGGGSWEMIHWKVLTGAARINNIEASPNYAEDSTVYAVETASTRIWKSINGGTTFLGLTAPANITAFYAVDGSTYYTGAAGAFYKSGRFTTPALTFTPNDIEMVGTKIYCGSTNGSVQWSPSDGASFIPTGNTVGGGGSTIAVTDSGTIYMAVDGTATATSAGVYKWDGTALTFQQIDDQGGSASTAADAISVTFAGAVAGDDVAISTTPITNISVTTTAGAPTFAFAQGGPPGFAHTLTITATTAADAVTVTTNVAANTLAISDPGVANSGNVVTVANLVDADADMAAVVAGLAPLVAGTGPFNHTLNDAKVDVGVFPTDIMLSPDGTLYASNADAGQGMLRSVDPGKPVGALRGMQIINKDLAGPLANAQLQNLQMVAGDSNTLYAVATGLTDTFPYFNGPTRIVTWEDTLAKATAATAPANDTILQGTSATFSWQSMGPGLRYQLQISTDAGFANIFYDTNVAGTNTIGTSISVAGMTPGTTYYWRVRVITTGPQAYNSKWSATASFTPELGVLSAGGQVGGPDLQSPAYGSDTVGQRPTFSWLAVPGADTYELEVSTNPFFAMADAKGPLSHTTWTWEDDLEYGTTYYWRVRGVADGTTFSPWAESVFTVMTEPVPAPPPVVVEQAAPAAPAPAPEITLTSPEVKVTIPEQAAPTSAVTPAIIWAIIIIGAILVIAVIVLIVRTRRVP